MILDTIAESTRKRVEEKKKNISPARIQKLAYEKAEETKKTYRFKEELFRSGISFICEVKKASPSKGLIAPSFPYLQIAQEYEEAGAGAISVLTEPEYFMGSDQYLEEIKRAVSVPVLRKDFTVDAYQIYEAKALGADAVLLICSITEGSKLKEYLRLCKELGLSALVEAHDESEISEAVEAGAEIIGVNNRDLKTFQVDAGNCLRLRDKVPDGIAFVAESGIKTPEDINLLEKEKVNAVLIGETLMRSEDKKQMLRFLKGE